MASWLHIFMPHLVCLKLHPPLEATSCPNQSSQWQGDGAAWITAADTDIPESSRLGRPVCTPQAVSTSVSNPFKNQTLINTLTSWKRLTVWSVVLFTVWFTGRGTIPVDSQEDADDSGVGTELDTGWEMKLFTARSSFHTVTR